MSSKSDFYSLPPAVRRIAESFRKTGWVSFWAQVGLAAISGVVLLLAAFGPRSAQAESNLETSFGIFFAACGIATLFLGAYWAYRYTRLSLRLRDASNSSRPKPGDVIQALRIGLIINLIGMTFTLFGAQAIVGTLLAKSFAGQSTTTFAATQLVQPIDIFVVQANVNTILAHFIGIVASLWLVRGMSRQ